MKIVFYSARKDRERRLAEAFIAGARIFAERAEARWLDEFNEVEADVAAIIGVKALTTPVPEAYKQAGRKIVFIDKGHFGRGEYHRVSVNAFMPTQYLGVFEYPMDRLLRVLPHVKPMKPPGADEAVLYAGSSDKYTRARGLGGATEYAEHVIRQIQAETDRPVVYRPKPSWSDAVPIPGARFSGPGIKFAKELQSAHAVVTHGSNAALEALAAGVPAIVLGDGAARPLAATMITQMEQLPRPSVEDRVAWFSKLAYCQWTESEMRSGQAWEVLADQICNSATDEARF